MAIAYICVGSNKGDREDHVAFALRNLSGLGKIRKASGLYETEPVGLEEQSDFLNMVVELETSLLPEELLAYCLAIEEKRGRKERIGPRTLDLDILLYDDLITLKKDLVVPHPRMHERAFVLIPLNEIAPTKVHPPTMQTISELLAACTDNHSVKKYAIEEIHKEN